MKRIKIRIISCLLAAATCIVTAGCFGCNSSDGNTYTVQYTDDSGTKQITVTQGQPFSLDAIPEKTGYDFLGLYDAEVGGTQYVNANGSSVSVYTSGKSIVLYPQYEAKTYTIILDYRGATVTGSRQVTARYGESLPELPKNLTLEHSEFSGWYTEENCGGTLISDSAGLIPKVSVLNENNFDLSDEDNYITLYAGFEVETLTVTFCFESGMDTEEVEVAYNTPISEVVPETRVNGNAVLTWATDSDKTEVFNGKVTEDITLYAVEYAPVIELDTNGGDEIAPVVARAGATIALPTPTRTNYKFAGWETTAGETVDYTTMPSESTTLKATWQAMIVFDSNGGSEVDNISAEAGTSITLPTPEKEDFIFAGWYTSDKEQYTKTTMPSASVELKAGWYKALSKEITIRSVDDSSYSINFDYYIVSEKNTAKGPTATMREVVDLSELIIEGCTINFTLHWKCNCSTAITDMTFNAGFYFYDAEVVSDSNYLGKVVYDDITSLTKTYEYTDSYTLSGDKLYLCYYVKSPSNKPDGYKNCHVYFSDIYIELGYPDTTYLYL